MSQKSKLVGNSIAMLTNRLTQGVATFVLSAAIARILGAYALGQYLLAFSYYIIFVNLSSQGFKTLFTREIAREPAVTATYFVSGTLLQLIFSILGYLGLVTTVYLLPYSDDTSQVCYLLGLTIIPFALSNITESIFQAQEKMHLIAISTVPIYILRLIAMIWIMQTTHEIRHVAMILTFSEAIILLAEGILLVRIVQPKWQVDWQFMWNTIHAVKTLFAIEGIGIIAAKVDVLILSLLGSEALVGIYGSTMQLLQPFFVVSNSLTLAAFPRLSKAVVNGKDAQRQEAQSVINVLLCLGLPFLIGIVFHGSELLAFIYQKPSFAEAGTILNIVSVAIISISFSQVFSYVLISNGLEKFNLLEVIITTVSGSLVGIILISQYQLMGAAFMSLTMSISNFLVFTYTVNRRIFRIHWMATLQTPLLVSGIMAITFWLLQKTSLTLLPNLMVATATYLVIVSSLVIQHLGGISYLRTKISKIK
jgi:O-antigen/teichoic acid export membrane protein